MSLYQAVEEKVRRYFASLLLDGRLLAEALKKAARWGDDRRAAEQVGALIYKVKKGVQDGGIEGLKELAAWAEAHGYGPEDFSIEHELYDYDASLYSKALEIKVVVRLINGRYELWRINSVVYAMDFPKEELEKLRAEVQAAGAVLAAARALCRAN